MNYIQFVGLDVSKATLDVAVVGSTGNVEQSQIIENNSRSLKFFLKGLVKDNAITLFCLEPTGHYSNIAVAVLLEMNLSVWVAHPTDIKNSIGLQRGKNDKIDAVRIAQYAYRFHDKARLMQAGEMDRQALQQLLTQRELLVKDRAKYIGQLNDYENRIAKNTYAVIAKLNQKIIRELDKAIDELESQLKERIMAIPEMKRQFELLQTIPGVGKVLAQTMVVFTNGFSRFDNARALACHAGIAPFEYCSGSSVRGKNRVSHKSNKRLKSLLHMAALAAVKPQGDFRTYYERKVAEGKNKMSVLNAIRNKIIHRIFAVLKRNTGYNLVLS